MDITDFVKATGNEFATVAEDGITAGDVAGWIDTGSYAMNALLSGSIYKGAPSNKILGIGADPKTGKTFIALSILKGFLASHPDSIGLVFETESALTKETLVDRGIDVKRVGIIPVTTAQEFRNQALKVVANYEKLKEKDRKPICLILDSLGMLSTTKEMADSEAGSDTKDMTRAQLLKAAFRVLTLRLGRANIPLYVTNHVYDDVGGGPYASKVQGGGSGLIYAASTILTFSKAKEKTSDGEITGVIITVTAGMSRFTREGLKVKIRLKFDGGLDRYYGLLEIAEAAKIFKKVSTKYEFADGSKVFGSQIIKNPEKYFTKEVLDQIDEYTQRVFTYKGHSNGDAEYDATMDEEVHSEGSSEE